MHQVASLLARHELLGGLALTGTRLGAAAAPLARAVAVSSLTSLDLSGCSLGDEAATHACTCTASHNAHAQQARCTCTCVHMRVHMLL